MTQWIDKTRENFDIIVYDTPPITVVSDATVLVPNLHGLILNIRSGVTGQRVLLKTLSSLKDIGAAILGVILNGADYSSAKYYGKYFRR